MTGGGMILGAQNLTVMRGALAAVRDADFALEPGQLTAICGPNGAGKSSLVAAMAGLIMPQSGRVVLDSRDIANLGGRARARAIGYLPQDGAPAWDISVATLAGLGRLPWRAVPGRPSRARASEDERAIAKALATMQLADLAARPVSQLSGGERARALMARVLAGTPRWILADEPFASLDLAHRQHLAQHLQAQARAGLGVVVVMHDLATAMNHADRVLVLDKGCIVADGPPRDALSTDTIARVWQVSARWHGETGAMALAAR